MYVPVYVRTQTIGMNCDDECVCLIGMMAIMPQQVHHRAKS